MLEGKWELHMNLKTQNRDSSIRKVVLWIKWREMVIYGKKHMTRIWKQGEFREKRSESQDID